MKNLKSSGAPDVVERRAPRPAAMHPASETRRTNPHQKKKQSEYPNCHRAKESSASHRPSREAAPQESPARKCREAKSHKPESRQGRHKPPHNLNLETWPHTFYTDCFP